MAKFFIDRPVFAWVVSILIMLMGALAITKLPVAQYPSIAPPSISVTATYAGRVRRDFAGHRHLGHRAADERH